MIFKLPQIETEETTIRVMDCFKTLFFEDIIIQEENIEE